MSVEEIKAASRSLRGTLSEQLASDTDAFDHDGAVLLKFHGIYQQDDRDTRRKLAQQRLALDHSLMVRASVPGGRITADQWLALDRLAAYADGSMRLTTRQGVQFHMVPKGSLHDTVSGINACGLTTLAACGDVVRNIMACPVPDARQQVLAPALASLVRRFRPTTAAYWELWVAGDKAVSAVPAVADEGALYGDVYLPRKFKIALAWPGDNCVDVLANDVGIVPTLDGDVHTGFTVFAGGGMGVSHARPDDTYPHLAQALAWTEPDGLADLVAAVIIAHRDHGNREDRQRARLKYLVAERGVAWLRAEISATLGRQVEQPRTIAPWEPGHEHHGWLAADLLGLPVPNGRVTGVLREALGDLARSGAVERFNVTPRQDLLLGVADRAATLAILTRHGIALPGDVRPLRRLAIACPALPTCGQALGEAERAMPELITAIEDEAVAAGVGDEPIRINMTGCPNGCARPYNAEIGIVGRTKTAYDLHLGGSPFGDRLAPAVRTGVRLPELAVLVGRVLRDYAGRRADGESFGDYCARIGTDRLAGLVGAEVPA